MGALVSVIVPTYNSEATLDMCLCSIRAQTYPDVELIVVDSFSTDRTAEIARRWATLYQIEGERTAKKNYGAAQAAGEYLLFIDSDMELSPTVVAECVAEAQAHPGFGGIIIPETSVGEGFWALCKWLERECYAGDDLIESSRFFHRAVFTEIGGYTNEFIAGEDWDIHNRAKDGHPLILRIRSRILHHEGRLELRRTVGKKRYYGQSAAAYCVRYPELSRQQFSAGYRLRVFLRHWPFLLRHPILTGGMFLMKGLEWVAYRGG